MPTRILREGILTSERVNQLSLEAELFYRRLMSVLDDFGRYDGRICLLRVACYPLRVDEISDKDVKKWLDEVEKIGLLSTYSVENKPFLAVSSFNQRTRAKASKYPQPPDTCPSHDGHMTDTCQHFPAYTETETETETDTNTNTKGGASDDARALKAKLKVEAKEIIDHLNAVAGTSFSAKSKEVTEQLCARLRQSGVTVDGVKQMIDAKADEWSGDSKMEKFLRPSTLFSPKNFANYYGQRARGKVKPKKSFSAGGAKMEVIRP